MAKRFVFEAHVRLRMVVNGAATAGYALATAHAELEELKKAFKVTGDPTKLELIEEQVIEETGGERMTERIELLSRCASMLRHIQRVSIGVPPMDGLLADIEAATAPSPKGEDQP